MNHRIMAHVRFLPQPSWVDQLKDRVIAVKPLQKLHWSRGGHLGHFRKEVTVSVDALDRLEEGRGSEDLGGLRR